MSRVTIKDIASQLNVSIATVDRALHNRGRIHEETYKQIMLKVDELGYKPNRIASTLVKNTDTRIAFVTPKCNSFFEEIVRGAQTAADELLDFGVYIDFITQDSFFDSLGQAASMESLIEQKPDGILVVPLHPLLLSTSIDRASENGIPVITVNLDSKESKRICYVGQDPEKTGAIIGTLFGKHMNKGGDIVILNGITEISTLRLRADGFINRLKNSYPGINIIGSYEYVDDIKISFEIAKKIIKDIPSVSGIFANTAYGGVGVGMAIKEMGKCGSIVAIEPVAYQHTISSIEKMDRLLRRFPSPALQVIWDPVNLLPITGLEESQESFFTRTLDTWGDKIAAVHAKDFRMEGGRKKGDLPVGTGELDWPVLLKLLQQRKDNIDIILENTQPSTARSTMAFLKETAESGG